MAASYGSNATTGVPEIKHGTNIVVSADSATGKATFPTGVVPATGTGMPVVYEQVLGVGQTWQDVTTSRVAGVTYTNTTGKPIMVAHYFDSGNSGAIAVNNVTTVVCFTTPADGCSITTIVPNGSTYKYLSTATLEVVFELR